MGKWAKKCEKNEGENRDIITMKVFFKSGECKPFRKNIVFTEKSV